jgi:hypothetical protein
MDGMDVRHLDVHLPFCSHRCGYCDFVTVVGRGEQHRAYVDALLVELDRERGAAALAGGAQLERHQRFEVSFRLSTARNASCGTSTPPTCFIRFFPFFCFSSSFRLREMSPP